MTTIVGDLCLNGSCFVQTLPEKQVGGGAVVSGLEANEIGALLRGDSGSWLGGGTFCENGNCWATTVIKQSKRPFSKRKDAAVSAASRGLSVAATLRFDEIRTK